VIPFGATFLVFSDYMRPAVRISAFSHFPSIWVWTHDSIGLGEDGPTHQPIEQLAALRAIPNLCVIRPADANEVVEAWKVAINRRNGPTALVLTRQTLSIIDRKIFKPAKGLNRGAYVLADLGQKAPEIILMASGSEVQIILEAGHLLTQEGKSVRLVSFPSWDLFQSQDAQYQESVFPSQITNRLAIEAGVSMGWEKWVGQQGRIIALNHYGSSAPYKILFEKFGLTAKHVVEQVKQMIG
jgi:transketolase